MRKCSSLGPARVTQLQPSGDKKSPATLSVKNEVIKLDFVEVDSQGKKNNNITF